MGKLIPELISLLVPSTKKKERNNFTAKIKNETILKQKGKCAICRGRLNRRERDFHHKDGNKSVVFFRAKARISYSLCFSKPYDNNGLTSEYIYSGIILGLHDKKICEIIYWS